ncbi:MAG TPA: hypothetical protein VFH46_21455 [Pyrinomonadaceae bacterium]|nr:hypothetical protein [Pyrinomonadaceae bacterium]
MTVEHHHSESTGLHNRRHAVRSVLELVQDLIVLGLCAGLFAAMLIKLVHLGQSLVRGTDFSQVLADIMFILVLIELFRLLQSIWKSIGFRFLPWSRSVLWLPYERFC